MREGNNQFGDIIINDQILFGCWELEQNDITKAFEINNNGTNAVSITDGTKIVTLNGNLDVNGNNITGAVTISTSNLNAANITGVIQTENQPNIDTLGTLTTLDMGGDIDLNTNDITAVGSLDMTDVLTITTSNTTNECVLIVVNDTTDINADAAVLIRTNNNGGGDPKIDFDIRFIGGWVIGLDNSDGDKFKVSRGAPAIFGTNDFFVINTSGDIGIGNNNPTTNLHIIDTTDAIITIENPTINLDSGIIFDGNQTNFSMVNDDALQSLSWSSGTVDTHANRQTNQIMFLNSTGLGIGKVGGFPINANLHIMDNTATILSGDLGGTRSTLILQTSESSSNIRNRILINNLSGPSANSFTWYSDIQDARMTLTNGGDLELLSGNIEIPQANDTGIDHNNKRAERQESTQTISNASTTAIVWDDINDFDDSGITLDGATDTFTVNADGLYQIDYNVTFESNSTGFRFCKIVAGGRQVAKSMVGANAGNRTILTGSILMDLNDTQTIELQVFQNSGGNLDIGNGSGEASTYISIVKIQAPV